jgi:acyl carrier protein
VTIKSRLLECFAAVFPSSSAEQLEHGTTDTIAEWDSLATVNLVAVVEEEFQIVLDLDDLEELDSFHRFLQLIESKAA